MKKIIAALAIIAISASAYAFGTLVGQETNGTLKYCKYSNGVIITIHSYEICPVSIN